MDAPSPAHSGTQQADVQEANLADPHVEEAKEEQKGAEEHKAESAEETKEAPAEVLEITFPLEVIYCPVCSFPPGFCEFGPSFELCKRWIAYNCPELYPSLSEELTKLAEAPPPEEFKAFMKIKKTKTVDPSSLKISIQMKKRSGKKMVTEIKGLDLFNIKLKVAAKGLGKKFASGCSVVKEQSEEMIDLQGTFGDEVIDYLLETYPELPASAFDRKATTTKKKKKK